MSELTQVLRRLLPVEDPRALVDASTGDDAAVYLVADDRALVVSVDFFTPVVDEAYDFGRIAAANALSDIYAMGGRPLFALNLVGFPRDMLGEGILEDIVSGGVETCRAAGIPVLGGHSVDDPEPKFGMVAVGEAHPDELLRHDAARPGDILVLTKPLGTGVISTAVKAGRAPVDVAAGALETMVTLNAGAAEAARSLGLKAATDVTGFGLLGHLRAMLRASGVAGEVDAARVPLLGGAAGLAAAGHVPGGTKRNLADLAEDVEFAPGIPEEIRTLLADAQTSGGLLLATPADSVEALLEALDGKAPLAAIVGRVVEGRPGAVRVR